MNLGRAAYNTLSRCTIQCAPPMTWEKLSALSKKCFLAATGEGDSVGSYCRTAISAGAILTAVLINRYAGTCLCRPISPNNKLKPVFSRRLRKVLFKLTFRLNKKALNHRRSAPLPLASAGLTLFKRCNVFSMVAQALFTPSTSVLKRLNQIINSLRVTGALSSTFSGCYLS